MQSLLTTRGPRRARFGAMSLLAIALITPAMEAFTPTTAHAAGAGLTAVYDAIGPTVPGNVPSQAFQATQTAEFGDLVGLGTGPRKLRSVTVEMSSWGCESGTWNLGTCATTPGATFTHPLTLKLYAVNNALPVPATGAVP